MFGFIRDFFVNSGIVKAVENEDLDYLERVTEDDKNIVNEYVKDGMTPLHWAAKFGKNKVVNFLLSQGARLGETEQGAGFTALHISVFEDHPDTVSLLLDKGININVQSKNMETPLHIACVNGNTAMVRLLLDRGVDMATVEKYGKTPLHDAVQSENIETVKMLLEKGFNIDAQDRDGWTPLFVSLLSEAKNLEMLKFLLERRAQVNICDKEGKSALHYTVDWRWHEAAEVLLKNGADREIKDKRGETPLDLAKMIHYKELIDILSDGESAKS